MGGEIGRIRPTNVFERAGESRMTPPGLVDLVPGETEEFLLAPAGVVGEVEDILPRGGQVGADGEVFGVLEEALAGRIFAEPIRGSRARCRASPSGRRACPCGGAPRSRD